VFQTQAGRINPAGAIIGFDQQATGGLHGFLRARDGTFTMIDPPGAIDTYPLSDINPAGAITGSFIDAGALQHGFLRIP
jgi:hypothetical protein